MKQKIVITVSLLFCVCTIAFTACQKIETGKNIPQCIKKKIKKDAVPCLGNVIEYIEISKETRKIESRIYKFSYGNQYYRPAEAIPSAYYDEQCNLIDVIVRSDMGHYYPPIEYDNSIYSYNRYVYQYYEKK